MSTKTIDLRLISESLNGSPLPFGSEDVETTIPGLPIFNEPGQAGSGTIITRSRRNYFTMTLRARVGSARYKAIEAFRLAAAAPGFPGAPYTATAPQLGKSVSGLAFPGEGGDWTIAESIQEAEFQIHLTDVQTVESPAPGLAV